jgi:hypothetical protein
MSSMLVRHPMDDETAGLMAGGFAWHAYFDTCPSATIGLPQLSGSLLYFGVVEGGGWGLSSMICAQVP